MAAREGVETGVKAGEGLAVRGEDEEIVGQLAQSGDRGQPVAERVGLGLAEAQRDVRGDAGQHLVAGDHQLALVVDQAGMFGRMAAADHHPPVAPADANRVAVLHAHEADRDRD